MGAAPALRVPPLCACVCLRAHARPRAESTNARVVGFSVLSVVVLAALAAWQMYSLKKFFKQKKVI